MPQIKFVVEHQTLQAPVGSTIRQVALQAGIYVNREFLRGFNCGGRGLCGTCQVWVDAAPGATSTPNVRERIRGMGAGRRLACQTKVLGDVAVNTMPGGDDRRDTERHLDPTMLRAPDPEPAPKPAKAAVASEKTD